MADLSEKVADMDIGTTKANELVSPKSKAQLQKRFSELVAKDNIDQAEFFLKSFGKTTSPLVILSIRLEKVRHIRIGV